MGMSKNYVWYSTQESRDNGTTSVLAIVETLFFVALTWGIAYYYDFYTHIYTAIAIAPFLLLRTPESTKKAIDLFLYKHNFNTKKYYKDMIFWTSFIIYISFFGLLYLLFTQLTFTDKNLEFGLTMISLGTGILVLFGITHGGFLGTFILAAIPSTLNSFKDNIFITALYILFFPVIILNIIIGGLFFFIKSLVIKVIITIFYTLKYPIRTLLNLTKNWQEQTSTNDIFYAPELLPQIHKRNDTFQLSGLTSSFNIKDDIFQTLFKIILIPIWSLAYLYRFSIKSTAWFFFPLAYLANLDALQNEKKKSDAIKTQTWEKLFWFNVIISAVLFLYFKFTGQYLDLLGLSEKQLSSIKDYMPQLQHYFVPQAMWLLVVAVALYFIMYLFISKQEHIGDKEYSTFTYWIIKLIHMLWMTFLAWHLVVFTNQYVFPELPKLFGMLQGVFP